MDTLVEFARGPLFRFAAALALLGLARHVVLTAWGIRVARRRAGDGMFPLAPVARRTLTWLGPARYLAGNRPAYAAVSVLFHAGVILVPVFLAGHVRLWRRGLGVGWPALPPAIADGLTLLTVATGVLLVVGRAWYEVARRMSRLQDWLVPALVVLAFASGWLVAHPARNPFDVRAATLVHVAAGDLLLILTPFTKIAHCVLLPFSQLVAELGWRFVPGAGREVARTLGKEGQRP